MTDLGFQAAPHGPLASVQKNWYYLWIERLSHAKSGPDLFRELHGDSCWRRCHFCPVRRTVTQGADPSLEARPALGRRAETSAMRKVLLLLASAGPYLTLGRVRGDGTPSLAPPFFLLIISQEPPVSPTLLLVPGIVLPCLTTARQHLNMLVTFKKVRRRGQGRGELPAWLCTPWGESQQ